MFTKFNTPSPMPRSSAFRLSEKCACKQTLLGCLSFYSTCNLSHTINIIMSFLAVCYLCINPSSPRPDRTSRIYLHKWVHSGKYFPRIFVQLFGTSHQGNNNDLIVIISTFSFYLPLRGKTR